MADYQIDELSLKIDIQGASKKNAENIRDIASAIRSLNKAVSNSGALNNLKAYSKNLQKLAGSIRSSFADIKSGTAAGTVTPKMTDVGGGRTNKKITDKLPTGTSNRKNIVQNQKDLNKALNDTEKSGKKAASGWSKFTKSIGRIAMYRAIRAVLKSITQAMVEGVQNYAKYSDSANKAISNIKNSFQQVKDSFGVTLGYLLEAFEPVITAISDGVTQLAENINMALASMSGKSTYSKAIKQNEDYAKSLDKVNGKLLSFDKFESLNKDGQSNEPRYEEVELGDELPEDAQAFKEIFGIIKDIIDIVKELGEALKPIFKTAKKIIEKIVPVIKDIVGYIKDGIDYLDEIGALEPILWGIAAVLAVIALTNPFTAIVVAITAVIFIIGVLKQHWGEIVEFFKQKIQAIKDWFNELGNKIKAVFTTIGNTIKKVVDTIKKFFVDLWHNIANGFASMINGIVNGFIKFVNILIDGLNIILKPLDLIAGIFGGKVQIPHWEAQMNWKPYAKGGVPEVGTVFYAGEAGAEIVSTSRSGQTGVANVEQISQAMLQALINYNAAQNGQNNTGNVYLDGRQVGQLVESSVYNEGVRVGHFKRA